MSLCNYKDSEFVLIHYTYKEFWTIETLIHHHQLCMKNWSSEKSSHVLLLNVKMESIDEMYKLWKLVHWKIFQKHIYSSA